MALDLKLRQDIVDALVNLPAFQSENGRQAMLLTAGLNEVVKSIELSGSAAEFVPRLVERLDHYGMLPDQRSALVHLLEGIASQLGANRRATLHTLCDRLLAQAEQAAQYAETCSYRGLSAFREEDEEFFFGRDTYTAKLVDAVQHQPFVAVLGASGSGKSSLVYAGLIPHLRRQSNWHIACFRPGDQPLQAVSKVLIPFLYADDLEQISKTKQLTEQLRRGEISLQNVIAKILEKDGKADRFLLFIDQFEEVYALCDNVAERQRFIDELLHLTPSPSPKLGEGLGVRLIITLRSDFLGQTHSTPELSHLIADHSLIVPAMNSDELRQAIAEPAKEAGQPLSTEVVDLLIEQTKEREGALPLLEFALTRIWEGLSNGIDPTDTLKQIGGVGGALAGVAQKLYDELNTTEQQIARRAFLAMIRLGEGAKDTRRKVAMNEIVGHKDGPEQVTTVLRHFAQPNARLITLDANTAEIAHEALFDHWDALKSWLDASRDDLRFHRHLADAAQYWDTNKRPDGLLWRSPDLELLQQYHQRNQQDMTALQVAFFQDSIQKQRQATFRKRVTRVGLMILTVVSVIAAIWAIRSERFAQQEREKAEINEIGTLNQTATALFASHDELNALLVAVKAGKKIKSIEEDVPIALNYRVSFNLENILSKIRQKNRIEGFDGIEHFMGFTLISPNGSIAASAVYSGDGTQSVKFFDLHDKKFSVLKTDFGQIQSMAFSSDSRFFAVGESDTVKIYDLNNITQCSKFLVNLTLSALKVNPD